VKAGERGSGRQDGGGAVKKGEKGPWGKEE